MHGVQPAANVIPIINAPAYPAGLPLRCIFLSLIRKLRFRKPDIKRPKIMTSMPPIILIHSWYLKSICPTAEDDAPREINTAENPNMNANEFVMVRFLTLFLSAPGQRSSE